MPKFWGLHNPK